MYRNVSTELAAWRKVRVKEFKDKMKMPVGQSHDLGSNAGWLGQAGDSWDLLLWASRDFSNIGPATDTFRYKKAPIPNFYPCALALWTASLYPVFLSIKQWYFLPYLYKAQEGLQHSKCSINECYFLFVCLLLFNITAIPPPWSLFFPPLRNQYFLRDSYHSNNDAAAFFLFWVTRLPGSIWKTWRCFLSEFIFLQILIFWFFSPADYRSHASRKLIWLACCYIPNT